ncbi:hypothetical protein ACEWY4_007296 [Coilia grayii]|uniref:Uncharacterized protein n=1 Tax=Coilia grayii TaxID=363190 RepID=A0ABD1KG75_9TELE
MDWKQPLCCLLCSLPLLVTLEIQTINSINELEERNFGKTFPQHGIPLLYWFSTLIDIDQNAIIRFKEGSYDPVTDIPFELVENSGSLPYMIPSGERAYYSAGDFESGSFSYLPFYVTQDFYNSRNHAGKNLDRIIIVIDKWYTPVRVDQVYVAEVSECNLPNVTSNTSITYKVGIQLLRQIITLTSPLDCQNKFLKEIFPHLGFSLTLAENMFGQPGFPLFMALSGYDLVDRYNITAQAWSCSPLLPAGVRKSLCDTSRQELAIRTSHDGHAVISWHGLPSSVLKVHTTVALFQTGDRSTALVQQRIDGQASGTLETSVPLNPGLQVQLIKQDVSDATIWQGPEFNDGNRQIPVSVGNASASMQLFTRKGYAGVRLYIRKTFVNWRDDFYYSWVGFYASEEDSNEDYLSGQWQWVTRFTKHKLLSLFRWDVYEYVCNTAITPGLHARFFLTEYYEWARTKPWDM